MSIPIFADVNNQHNCQEKNLKMDINREKEFEPLCRFGPGGDFINDWPGDYADLSKLSSNRLGRILNSLSEIIAALLSSEHIRPATAQIEERSLREAAAAQKEKTDYGSESESSTSDHTPPIRVIKSNSQLPGEPLLFADDWRISGTTANKPKHRIRTHHRTSRKRASIRLTRQGTFFESDFKGARTA